MKIKNMQGQVQDIEAKDLRQGDLLIMGDEAIEVASAEEIRGGSHVEVILVDGVGREYKNDRVVDIFLED
jgi:translation elongation factor P/translation initiation factor 5A